MNLVTITTGCYSVGKDAYREIKGVQFPVLNATIEHNEKGSYIEVDGTPVRGYPKRAFKVFVKSTNDFVLSSGTLQEAPPKARGAGVRAPTEVAVAAFQVTEDVAVGETDEQIKARIAERFDVMDEIIQSSATGEIRGTVISGPPGIGKSWGVSKALRNSIELPQLQALLEYDSESGLPKPPEVDTAQNERDIEQRFRFVSGHCTPLKLYEILFQACGPNMVLVFDDCDSILRDEDSLNLLKKALDTTDEKRILSWNSTRERPDVPPRFEFYASIIFITNLNFENPAKASSALQEHLAAIMSRVYYIDLAITNVRDKYLHIEGVCKDHDLLKHMGLSTSQVDEVMAFFKANLSNFREVSIRTVQKIAKLCLTHENWLRVAVITTFKTSAIIDYDRTIDVTAIGNQEVVALFDKNVSYEGESKTMAQHTAEGE